MRHLPRLLALALMSLSCAVLAAQAIPIDRLPQHPFDKTGEGKASRESDKNSSVGSAQPGSTDLMPPKQRQEAKNTHRLPAPAFHVDWVRTLNANGFSDYAAFKVTPGTAGQRQILTSDELRSIFDSNVPIVNSGDVPRGSNWLKLTASKGAVTVVHEPGSLNRDWTQVSEASALADRPLPPDHTVIYNALPQETESWASQNELTRMRVTPAPDAWKALNDQIRATSSGLQSHVATKHALLRELATGDSDVIVVYAHVDGLRLHLPGGSAANHASVADYTISIDELARIDRTTKPARNRVIVLAACSTAAHVSNADSLVHVLLKQGIAGTVLATDKPYDARNIPDLMERLKNHQPLRQAGGQLRQYVELRPIGPLQPQPIPFQSIHSIQESETYSGE